MFGLGSRKGSQEVKKSGRAEQMKTNQSTGAFHFPLFLASALPIFAMTCLPHEGMARVKGHES